jgi:hypothetical protein
METIQLSRHIGADGVLRLEMLVGPNVHCDITIQVRPRLSPEEWRAFLESTAGILADDPIERGVELPEEQREPIE